MDRAPKRGNRAKTPTPWKTSKLAQHVRATLKTGQYVEQTWPIRQNVETGQKRRTPWKTSKLAQHVRATLKTGQYVEKTWKKRQKGKTGKNARLRGKRPN